MPENAQVQLPDLCFHNYAQDVYSDDETRQLPRVCRARGRVRFCDPPNGRPLSGGKLETARFLCLELLPLLLASAWKSHKGELLALGWIATMLVGALLGQWSASQVCCACVPVR